MLRIRKVDKNEMLSGKRDWHSKKFSREQESKWKYQWNQIFASLNKINNKFSIRLRIIDLSGIKDNRGDQTNIDDYSVLLGIFVLQQTGQPRKIHNTYT